MLLDRYAYLDSPVHRAPAGLKLGALVVLAAGVALLPPHPALHFAVAAMLAITAASSRVPVSFLLRKLLLIGPFALGVVIATLFQENGVSRFFVTLTRTSLCLLAGILVAATTPFTEYLRVLRAWRLPPLLVATLALTYRYLFVLVDEAWRMRRARAARTFSHGRRHLWWTLSTVAARLFVRGVTRADRIQAAMAARGWRP